MGIHKATSPKGLSWKLSISVFVEKETLDVAFIYTPTTSAARESQVKPSEVAPCAKFDEVKFHREGISCTERACHWPSLKGLSSYGE